VLAYETPRQMGLKPKEVKPKMRAKLISGVKWQGALKQIGLQQGLCVYGSPLEQNILSKSETSVKKYSYSRRESFNFTNNLWNRSFKNVAILFLVVLLLLFL
jgi:hypothetical protein